MVEQMKFNPMFQPAMMQVFGRTLICRDIDKASFFAKNSSHDCVTLDGAPGLVVTYSTHCSLPRKIRLSTATNCMQYTLCTLKIFSPRCL